MKKQSEPLIEPLAEGLVKLESLIDVRYKRLEKKIRDQISLFDHLEDSQNADSLFNRLREIRVGFDHVQIEVEGARSVLLEEANELHEDLQAALDILQGLSEVNESKRKKLSGLAEELSELAVELGSQLSQHSG